MLVAFVAVADFMFGNAVQPGGEGDASPFEVPYILQGFQENF